MEQAVQLFASQALLVVGLTLLAFIGESLVEYVLMWLKFVVFDEDVRTVVYKLAGGAFGLLLAFVFGLDLISALVSLFAPFEPTQATVIVGQACTGLAMGRGSNWLHDLGKKWFGLNQQG